MMSLVAIALAAAPHQSALDPAGPHAARIESLWWVLAWVGGAVYVLTIAALFVAVARGRRRAPAAVAPEVAPDPERERRARVAVTGAVAVSAVVLLAVMVESFLTGRAISAKTAPDPIAIRVTGHQWWWDVRYDDPTPANTVTTANEIHVPVGRPVELTLTSVDVIHSFWAPNLNGKRDLIPGQTSKMWFQADRPGVYRGQCAEFCGYQHAQMAFAVVAESPDAFEAWLAHQREPAPPPSNPAEARGQQVFLSGPCVMCHAIGGTSAGSRFGPNLTHLASRSEIAASTLQNTRAHVSGWIVDSQELKPGNRMPPVPLEPGDVDALLTYLESLK